MSTSRKIEFWRSYVMLAAYLIIGSFWLGNAWRAAKQTERLPFTLSGVVRGYEQVGHSIFGTEYTIVVGVKDEAGEEVIFRSPRTTVFQHYALGQSVPVRSTASSIPARHSLPSAQVISSMTHKERLDMAERAARRSATMELADPKHVWEEFWWSAALATIAVIGLSAATFVLEKRSRINRHS